MKGGWGSGLGCVRVGELGCVRGWCKSGGLWCVQGVFYKEVF